MLNLNMAEFRSYFPDLTDDEIERRYYAFTELFPFLAYTFQLLNGRNVDGASSISQQESLKIGQFSYKHKQDREILVKKYQVVEIKL